MVNKLLILIFFLLEMTICATCVLIIFFFKNDFYSASHSTEESQTNTSAFASRNYMCVDKKFHKCVLRLTIMNYYVDYTGLIIYFILCISMILNGLI